MIRNNPQVCFQVDDIETIFKWKSVIAWGVYQQITYGEEMHKAMQEIIHHIMPLMTNTDGHPSQGITENESGIGTSIDLILYKICLNEKTGRFEQP